MFDRAVVHIGTPKTGTTSIQRFLRKNKDSLLEQGFAVPTFYDINQRWIALFCDPPGYWDELTWQLATADGYLESDWAVWQEHVEDRHQQLRDWATQVEASTLLFSNEHLYGRLLGVEDIERFASVIDELAETTEIVVYLREPLAYRISEWSTAVRHGLSQDELQLPPPNEYWDDPPFTANWPRRARELEAAVPEDYRTRLQWWESVFPGRVQVRLFDKASWVEEGLLGDFCAAVGITWAEDFVSPEPENESFSWGMMQVLNCINRDLPQYMPDGRINAKRGRLSAMMSAGDDPTAIRYVASQKEREDYWEFFAESNEWVRERYFPEKDRLWASKQDEDEESPSVRSQPNPEPTEAIARFALRSWLGFVHPTIVGLQKQRDQALAQQDELAALRSEALEQLAVAERQLASIMSTRTWRYFAPYRILRWHRRPSAGESNGERNL